MPQVSLHHTLAPELEAGGAEQRVKLEEAGRDTVRGWGEASVRGPDTPGGSLSGHQQRQQHSQRSRRSQVEHL